MHKSSYKTNSLYQLINKATDNENQAEDEMLNKHICSEILRSSDGPKVAAKIIIKVINKSLSTHCYQSIWYCLLLLDTAVKSTNSRFCSAILTKDFLSDFVKIMDKKYGIPDFVEEKFVYLIKDWTATLTNVEGYQNLVKYHKMLFEQPRPAFPNTGSVSPNRQTYPVNSPMTSAISPFQISIDPINSKDKLMRDIDVIETNLTVFSDMLTSANPETLSSDEETFLKDLYEICQKMQERISEVLSTVLWEDITNQLLQINDKINYASDRYKRLLATRSQRVLSGGNTSDRFTTEIYDEPSGAMLNSVVQRPNVPPVSGATTTTVPQQSIGEIYDYTSLPSYNQAVSRVANRSNNSDEQNLIDFSDERITSKAYKDRPLPPVPDVTPDLLTGPPLNQSVEDNMTAEDFDMFLASIVKNKPTLSEPSEEEYAPPLYDEALINKPNQTPSKEL